MWLCYTWGFSNVFQHFTVSDQNHFSLFIYAREPRASPTTVVKDAISLWLNPPAAAVAWHRLAARPAESNVTYGAWGALQGSGQNLSFLGVFKADLGSWVHRLVMQECWCFRCVFIVSCVFLINKQLIGTSCVSGTFLSSQSQTIETIWKNTFIHRTDTMEV